MTTVSTRPAPRPARTRHHRGVVSTTIGFLGELLITAGVLLGLFVVWQLWWTDVQAGREHAQILASLEWPDPPDVGPGTAAEEPKSLQPREGKPPVIKEPSDATVFAKLYVPRFGENYVQPIAEGVDKATILDRIGIGHYPGTALPGEIGNFATAGHRTTYGKPYHLVAELRKGDPLVVRTEKTWYVYRMTDSKIVYPWDVEVISPVPGLEPGDPLPKLTERYMTMTACHPMYSAAQRFIIHAKLDYWAPVKDGIPPELVDAGVEVKGA
jgi:sortase A